ncbi:uncharacterized protein LOC110861294 [Folsomia candida]|uniref:Uncharacterized protein n=1 Tax=Folsomia candida TaxID=158441 RepID=A0A226D409_FOLCA|nr:uncharacterized protein LOC110861294 [Folsomia candida]OXA39391.1 hypothetical protein Fcan01_25879 [Folsomia candida]
MEDARYRDAAIFAVVSDMVMTSVNLLKWGEIGFQIIGFYMGMHKVASPIHTIPLVFAAFILHFGAVWTAYKMTKACRLETQLDEGIRRGKNWRNLAIVLILFNILGAPTLGLKGYTGGMTVIFNTLRLIGIFVVHTFVGELTAILAEAEAMETTQIVTSR